MCLFFHATSTSHIYTLSLHDALPIYQNSWPGMWNRLDRGRNIIGWYHTHPAMGIFLSATDLRTQQLYFSDRKSTRLNSSHLGISYAVFCLKKKKRSKRSIIA